MALTNEDLQAIRDMMDDMMDKKLKAELQPIKGKLDKMDQRLDVIEFKQDRTAKKLDDLQLDVKLSERDIRRDVHTLRDEMDTVIELLKIHDIIQI